MVSDLILNNDSRITLVIPARWDYQPDDVQMWFIKGDKKVCIFNDSYNYVVLQETKQAIEAFRNPTLEYLKSKGYTFANRLFRMCYNTEEDEELGNHQLFGYRNYVTYLSIDSRSNAEITLVEVEAFDDSNLMCDTVHSSTLDRNTFLKWANELLSLAIKPDGSVFD